MCGRYSLNHKRDIIEDVFQVTLAMEYAPRYNIAPTQPVLIVRENPHVADGREATHVVWGLIPPWAEDPRIGSRMINARCETAAEKPSFRNPLRRRRCVIPVSGFYEWQKPRGMAEESLPRQPYYIHAADGLPLALAGLWEVWHGPDGELLESCTILTTRANAALADIHDRMPVIIEHNSMATWLDGRNEDAASLEHFLVPAKDELLQKHPVSRRVNSVRNDSPELLRRDEPEGSEGFF